MTRPVLTTLWISDGPSGPQIRKAASTSEQLPEDPFSYADGQSGLQTPPYALEQLAAQLEGNSLHYRCVKQKSSDTVGRGFTLRGRDGIETPSAEGEDRWGEFVASVENDERGDESLKERVVWAHEDLESIGWGILEVSRRGDGTPDGLWHVPAATIRAHRDGRRFAQLRGGKAVWFKRFGLEGSVNRTDGGWSTPGATPVSLRGNELIVVRNYTPRSALYGLPDHIPAMAALAGWRAQAEFNVRFFDNQAIPSYAVIVEGADVSPAFEERILDHFRAIKGDPHRTIVIPVPGLPGDEATQVKVRFERLSVEVKDASFRLYKQDNALEICIAHGVPPYRIGWPLLGSLGGATAEEMTQVYLDSIVQPRQETWEQRLTRALLGPKGLAIPDRVLKANELDTRNELRDLEKAKGLWELGAITPVGVQRYFGMDERTDPAGELYIDQRPAAPSPFGVINEQVAKVWTGEVRELARIRKRLEALVPAEEAA